jgi:ribosomal protein S27E
MSVPIRSDFENPEIRGRGYGARVDCPACGWGRLIPAKPEGTWDCLMCGRMIRVEARVVAYPCVHWPDKCPPSGEGCESVRSNA